MTDGPQAITSSRLALAFETAGARATAPTIYIIPGGKITPVSTKTTEKRRVAGNRDPVFGVRGVESFKLSIPMMAIIEDNGLGNLLLATFGTDTPGSQLGSSDAYDHVFTANDTIKSFTLWCWDTLDPQDIRMVLVDTMKLEVDKDKNQVLLTFDCIGADMASSSTFGSASYITSSQKANMIPAAQAILEYGQPQSNVSKFWEKITITSKEGPKFGANSKAAVPAGSASPLLCAKGERDTTIDIDFVDIDGIERKRWRQGGDTLPTASAQMDAQAATKFRLRLFGSQTKAATSAIWGYAHQANTGTATVTWGGTYTVGLADTPAQYELYISTNGTPDKFKWRKNGGAWSAEVETTGAAQTLSDGVTVTFSSTSLSALNDTWFGFSHYQRMIEFTSPANVIDEVSQKDSTDFYKSTAKLFYEGGPSDTKPGMVLRNTKVAAYT